MAKPRPIKLCDIDHEEVYTAVGLFLRIPKAKTQGALRGTVDVHGIRRSGSGYIGTVFTESLDGDHRDITVTRGPNPFDDWEFSYTNRPTLQKADERDVLAHIDQKEHQMRLFSAELQRLQTALQVMRTVRTRYASAV